MTDRSASTRVLMGSLAATFTLVAAATLFPQGRELRLWGINHLAYYTWPVRLGALAIMALAFVPTVARRVYEALRRFHGLVVSGGGRSTILIGVVAIASVFVFYYARAATQLLGDGALLAQSFEAAYAGHQTVLMRSVEAILANDQINPGTMLLFYWVVKAAVSGMGMAVVNAMALLPSILGGVFVLLFLTLLRRASLPSHLGTWLLVLGLSAAGLQLFFGYIEVYAPIFVVLSAYVVASFFVIHRRRKPWLPAVLLIASFLLHIQSVVFAPSLFFLLAWYLAKGRRRAAIRYGAPTVAGLTVLVAVVAWKINLPGEFYLPLMANEHGYGVVSPGHILDMLNEVLLLFPVALFAGAAWWAGTASGHQGEKVRRESKRFTLAVEWRFVLLALLPCVLYMTLFKPEIGMARDWDLFAMTTAALVPLALLVLNRYLALVRPDDATIARVSAPAMVIAIILGIGWFGVNASSARSTDRYESILSYDQTHAGYAFENLASYYDARGMMPEAIRAMEAGARISGNPRIYARLADLYGRNGDLEGGIELLYETMSKHPTYSKVRAKLIELLERQGRSDELMEVAREGVKLFPQNAIFHFALGESLIRRGEVEEGLELFRTCLTLDPPAGAREHIMARFREFGQEP